MRKSTRSAPSAQDISPNHRIAIARHFLQSLYGDDAAGLLTIWLWPSKYTHRIRAQNLHAAATYAVRQSHQCDVYVGVGLRGEHLKKGRGQSQDVIALPGLYIEVDVKHSLHKAQNLPESIDEARQLITEAIPLPPSLLIDSGHGLHGHWLWRELWLLDSEAEREAAATLLLRFQRTIQAMAKLRGWHVDGTADLARVLRIPGTFNRKDPQHIRSVTFIEDGTDHRYNPPDFEPYLLELDSPGSSAGDWPPLPDDLPSIDIRHLDVSASIKFLIATGTHPNGNRRYASRSEAEWALIQALIKAGYEDPVIAAVLLDPTNRISEKPREKGRKWVEQEIKRARAKAKTEPVPIDDEIDITSTPDEAEQDQSDTNAGDRDVHHGDQPSDDQSHPNGDGQGPSEPRHIVLPWSDYTNAVRLMKGHGQDLRYCHPWKQWLIYTGQRWIIDDTSEVMRRATRTVKAMAAELQHMDNAQAKAWLHHIKKSLAAPRLKAMISLAESEPPLPIIPAQLDANSWLLNCRNGTLDLRTGMLQSHRREDLLTKQIDVDYDPHASCPNWLGFLYRIMGGPSADEDGNEEALLERHERATSLVTFLQQLVGYSLTGDIAQHILIFLYGTGANGKSTFSETMGAMLGDYFQKAPTQLLMHRDRGGTGTASPEMARLFGARMVIAAEISEGQRLNEAQVKDLTGGDTIVARHLFKEFFEFRPTHKLWMYGNHKPVIRGTDPGIWRRVHLIPFTVKIPDDEQDPHFREKFLMPELTGILNWAVQGCLDWQRNGLNVPEAVEAATNSYRTEMDVLHHFFNDRCVILRDASVRVSVLYAEYRKWCEANQEMILNQRDFSMRVAERGFERNRGAQGYHYWRGIGVFTPPGGDDR